MKLPDFHTDVEKFSSVTHNTGQQQQSRDEPAVCTSGQITASISILMLQKLRGEAQSCLLGIRYGRHGANIK